MTTPRTPPTPRTPIRFVVTVEERDYVKHAASLRNLTLREYIVRAINASLRRDGVDALLIMQSDWR